MSGRAPRYATMLVWLRLKLACSVFHREVFAVQAEGERTELKIKTVVYATDLSLCCQNAGFYAAFLAQFFSAELLVTHAFILSQAAMEVEFDPALVSEQRKDLASLLSRKAAKLSRDGMRSSPALVEGDPRKVLVELADEHGPSLMVVGTHGGGWIQREIIGSVAETILRSTSWPVLTVGPQVRSAAAEDLRFKHILYATDFTPSAAGAAMYAACFAEAFGARIDVLNVIERESLDRPDRLRELSHSFAQALNKCLPRRAEEFSNPRTFVEVGDAHRQILQHIKDHDVDLLVLGIQQASHLGIGSRNSQAFQIILHAICPVLTIAG
jgi:nucleotide-binding universal stress UspA family protein